MLELIKPVPYGEPTTFDHPLTYSTAHEDKRSSHGEPQKWLVLGEEETREGGVYRVCTWRGNKESSAAHHDTKSGRNGA